MPVELEQGATRGRRGSYPATYFTNPCPKLLQGCGTHALELDLHAEAREQVECRVWLRSGSELPAKRLLGRPAADGKPAMLIALLPSGIELVLPLSTVRAMIRRVQTCGTLAGDSAWIELSDS